MISAVELTRMRYDAELLLPSTCTIQTVSNPPNDQGGNPLTWANTYTSIACRLAPVSQSDKTDVSGDKFTVHPAWHLSIPYDQAIATNKTSEAAKLQREFKGQYPGLGGIQLKKTDIRVNRTKTPMTE